MFLIFRAHLSIPQYTTQSSHRFLSFINMPKAEISLAETTSSTCHSQRRGLLIRDCIIGFADGLTVPFALTAGLSALGDSHLVVMGGLAELLAGALSMGLGAYLAAITEQKRYEVEERRMRRELKERPSVESVLDVLGKYGVPREVAGDVAENLKGNEDMWVKVSCASMFFCV